MFWFSPGVLTGYGGLLKGLVQKTFRFGGPLLERSVATMKYPEGIRLRNEREKEEEREDAFSSLRLGGLSRAKPSA